MASARRSATNTSKPSLTPEFFNSKQVPWLQNFLKERGIQVSGKRKAELEDLCWKSVEIKVPRCRDLENPEDVSDIVRGKLETDEGLLLNPLDLHIIGWSHVFTNIPDFGFPDIYNYLVGECQYTQESLKAYKSLLGYKLYFDGHVENLEYNQQNASRYHCFRFAVRPTERSKLDGRDKTYKGFFILNPDGAVHSAYCQCKGGADGGCRHIAASLFDLLAYTVNTEMNTCTGKACIWARKGKRNEGSLPVHLLDTGRPEYGKTLRTGPDFKDFNPVTITYDTIDLQKRIKTELFEANSNAGILAYLPAFEQNIEREEDLDKFISNDDNVANEEITSSEEVCTLKEYADVFVAEKASAIQAMTMEQLTVDFLSSISLTEDQRDLIYEQTKQQSQSQFWFDQRAGRVTASSFYTVCHRRSSTDPTNIIKKLMNYCPMKAESTPQQLLWGHEKEEIAIDLYARRLSKKHKQLNIAKCGLIVDKSLHYLAASPDGIRSCACCPKKVVIEVKSMFTKRNLLPAVAAEENLITDENGNHVLKRESKWNYQIQGELACANVDLCDLVIYTFKGILVVPVSFDKDLWEEIVQKLKRFYSTYMVPELLTSRIQKQLPKE